MNNVVISLFSGKKSELIDERVSFVSEDSTEADQSSQDDVTNGVHFYLFTR